MSLQDKYAPVITLINNSGGREVSIVEEAGVLKVAATVPSPTEKIAVWNEIKRVGGEAATDIMADIRMDSEVPTGGGASAATKTYTVQSGDTLSKIAKEQYGDANDYMKIADANGISNPDLIKPGQELIIP
ncbi:MAG: LysM peptidoglycan-binding domain-containing protein [Ignavibacteria bacterium]|jgi:nucleoid-associated protein YgaU|nr:LysM peptidoglycan-binding domain-containing protein [Ignavibacteria bacterium]MBK9229203.1 LysM peptidoglycan-binding domain-containing protein [Ignavibacteria bacterium]